MKRHFLSITLAAMSFLVFSQAPAVAQDKPAKPAATEAAKPASDAAKPAAMTEAANNECDVNAAEQQCCSAAGCTGKVLSNRDAHNCKVKSSGKSWHAAAQGGKPAACSRM